MPCGTESGSLPELHGLWALEADRRFAGFTGIQWTVLDDPESVLEVGWWLARWGWGQGWATEAGAAALRRGLEAVERVISVTAVLNKASWQVMRRLGMSFEREFDQPPGARGQPAAAARAQHGEPFLRRTA
jgi:RimJ/RimL family protein N-acetyltransferase